MRAFTRPAGVPVFLYAGRVAILGLLVAGAACAPAPRADTLEARAAIADGREIALSQCSACHAIERSGPSPRADAPPLRSVLQRYDATALAEALIAGIKIGHPDMPNFELSPVAADDLVAYMKSIEDAPARN